MTLAARQHPVDALMDWFAPALLSAAALWAAWRLGLAEPLVACAALVAFGTGIAAMRLIGAARPTPTEAAFEPPEFSDCAAGPDELLLDDPLVEIEPDSRVVRLFARDTATPGEMVARIEDYLGEGRRAVAAPAALREESASPPDASAALHAALANIRASLR